MADFIAALDAALRARYGARRPEWVGVKRPVTHRQGLKARMRALMEAHGGNRRAAAASAGIPYSSWGHMLSGKRKVSAKNLSRLESAYTGQVTGPKMTDALNRGGTPHPVTVWAEVTANPGIQSDSPKRNSTSHASAPPGAGQGWRPFKAENVTPAALEDVVRVWMREGPIAAAKRFEKEVEDAYLPFEFQGDHVEVDW